jgi:hypothetical protein
MRTAFFTGDKKAEERAELEKTGDYIVDEKAKTVTLTEGGMAQVEKLLGVQNLWDPSNMDILHHVNQALRAHSLFQRDVDYVVNDGQVVIVDEFTGRMMPGRRWSDGLHQAIEAKENVKIESENQTLATITFQNYFRKYSKLAGMTGTAETEREEFGKIYGLDVMVVIGGYNSSNTQALARICSEKLPTFHIKGPEGIEASGAIRYRPIGVHHAEALAETWLRREGAVTVGLTAGASTPNNVVGEVVERILALRGRKVADFEPG